MILESETLIDSKSSTDREKLYS